MLPEELLTGSYRLPHNRVCGSNPKRRETQLPNDVKHRAGLPRIPEDHIILVEVAATFHREAHIRLYPYTLHLESGPGMEMPRRTLQTAL